MRNLPRTIGLSGRMLSGKGTVARMIREITGHDYREKQFGEELKLAAAAFTRQPIETFLTQEGKASILPGFGMTTGKFLQLLGQGMRETIYADVHIDAYQNGLDANADYINESVRYENEAENIRSGGGVLIRVCGDPSAARWTSGRDQSAPSEIALDDYDKFDVVLANNGSLDDLTHSVRHALQHIDEGKGGQLLLSCATRTAVWFEEHRPLQLALHHLSSAVMDYEKNPF